MAIHSSILVWKIPWTEEPGRLQSMRSQRIGHNQIYIYIFFLFIFFCDGSQNFLNLYIYVFTKFKCSSIISYILCVCVCVCMCVALIYFFLSPGTLMTQNENLDIFPQVPKILFFSTPNLFLTLFFRLDNFYFQVN